MLFKQLFDQNSSSYTYLIACPGKGESVLIDPVVENADRDLEVLRELGLNLTYTLETHIHADHITGALKLRALTGCRIAGPAMDDLPCRDIGIREGEAFRVGNVEINPLFTPGHTDAHHVFVIDTNPYKAVFSGDALLIEACGRTDFQEGNPEQLYDSIVNKLFVLPDDTLVYPAHDYSGRAVTTVGQEKRRNPRIGNSCSKEEFVRIMARLDLPYPEMMEYAVPGNRQCGRCPDNLPPGIKKLCGQG